VVDGLVVLNMTEDKELDRKVECRYLIGSRICGAVNRSLEGTRRRKGFCRNYVKNHCCYVCEQELCSIRCSYLDETGKQYSIDHEIEKYQKEIGKLTVLHANGEIGEQSYLAALKTMENKIAELKADGFTDVPPSIVPEPSFKPDTVQKPYESREYKRERPSALWYLIPLLFGLLGGVIMYVALRNEDEDKAVWGLWLGIGITVLGVLLVLSTGWLF
jgi:hypothetical protein